MPSPFIDYLDDLIADKAERTCSGWYLSLWQLDKKEIRQLNKLQNYCDIYGRLQDLISERCQEKFNDWRSTKGEC